MMTLMESPKTPPKPSPDQLGPLNRMEFNPGMELLAILPPKPQDFSKSKDPWVRKMAAQIKSQKAEEAQKRT